MDNSNKNLPNNPFLSSTPQAGAANPPTPTPPFDPNTSGQPLSSPNEPVSTWNPNPIPQTPAQGAAAGLDPLASSIGGSTSSFDQQNAVPQDQAITPESTFTPSPPPPPATTPSPDFSTNFNQTYTPPTPSLPQTPEANTSSLDNPWGAPVQPPAIDGSNQITAEQTYPVQSAPIPDPTTMNPNIASSPPPWAPQVSIPGSTEPAPTDLSHLINSGATEEITQPSSEPETLVAPAGVPEVPTVPIEGGKGFPKWLIGVGIGLLIIVAGASAYFILGIGQPPKTTTSIPATTSQNANQTPETTTPVATEVPQSTSTPEASGSANFGQLQESGTQTATSAADLLRQRQQGR